MKILHTADWHLGKRLYGHDLSEDHRLLFSWLLRLVMEEKIDALLISGDVFDLANPSSEARKQYYELLVEMNRLNCRVIITGGNHDSPSVLNAPKEVLKALDIHVIGGLPESLEDLLIPIEDADHKVIAVVAAIPFLRDSDLRQMVLGDTYQERQDAIRAGIKKVFDQAAKLCKEKYPDIPAVAMGHLYASGAISSESERDIQIGNLAGFDSDMFNDFFRYIALGHIHKPQDIDAARNVLYSGSPISLSFSEKTDTKRVILIELNDELSHKTIEVPAFRKLIKIEGSLIKIQQSLENLEENKEALPTLIEVEMKEDDYDPGSVVEFEALLEAFDRPDAEVVKQRITFKNKIGGSSALYEETVSIDELMPEEVFRKKMEKENLSDEQQQMLREAFTEILQSMHQEEL